MANEEMIQKHLDNFLAKIAGETPVDDTIQNSTEFWINKIAEQGGGGGGGKMYMHCFSLNNMTAKHFNLITASPDPFTTEVLASVLKKYGYNSDITPLTSALTFYNSTSGASVEQGAISSYNGTSISGYLKVKNVDGSVTNTPYSNMRIFDDVVAEC